MTLPERLAMLNACLNATSACLIIGAWIAIRRKAMVVHRALMLGAFATSSVFLASYLTRMAIAGDTRFLGQGPIRIVYFVLLASHVLLAIAVVPLVFRSLYLGLRSKFDRHRNVSRWTLPIWLYVSVTGVVVYLMLYQYPV